MGGESSNFFSQHTAFNDHRWFCISSCWRYCAHNTDFHLQGVDVYFLCVWCRGGVMQERELLSTQPHLPTSAMTLRHTAATSPQNTNHQWGWVQISVGVTEVKDKAAAEVKQAPAVGTPERHYRPLERAREKRRLRCSVRCVLCNHEFTDLEWSQAGWVVEKMVICKTCIDLMSAGSKHRAKIPHPTD